MIRKFPALLALLGLVVIGRIWYTFLFVALPEGANALEAAQQQAMSVLDPASPESTFFIGTLVSALLCLVAIVLFLGRKAKIAVGVVAINSLIAMFLFSPVLVLVIGLPLTLAGQVWKNA